MIAAFRKEAEHELRFRFRMFSAIDCLSGSSMLLSVCLAPSACLCVRVQHTFCCVSSMFIIEELSDDGMRSLFVVS